MIFLSIKKYFKKGILVVLVPAIVLYLLSAIFRIVDGLWISVVYKIFNFNLWPGVGFGATIILIVLLGWLVSLLEKMKLFQQIKSLPSLIFFSHNRLLINSDGFKPCLVELFHPATFVFAYISGEIILEGKDLAHLKYDFGLVLSDDEIKKMKFKFYKVFFPSLPALVTGYLYLVPEYRVIILENSSIEIARQIMSFGMPKIDLKILKKGGIKNV